jgi:hypothetical protein
MPETTPVTNSAGTSFAASTSTVAVIVPGTGGSGPVSIGNIPGQAAGPAVQVIRGITNQVIGGTITQQSVKCFRNQTAAVGSAVAGGVQVGQTLAWLPNISADGICPFTFVDNSPGPSPVYSIVIQNGANATTNAVTTASVNDCT